MNTTHDSITSTETHRPEFARKIVEKYLSSQANAFLIYGNTKDIYPVDESRYLGLVDFLVEALIKPDRPGAPKIVLIYDPVNGISFLNPLDKILIADEIGGRVAQIDPLSKGYLSNMQTVLSELSQGLE